MLVVALAGVNKVGVGVRGVVAVLGRGDLQGWANMVWLRIPMLHDHLPHINSSATHATSADNKDVVATCDSVM